MTHTLNPQRNKRDALTSIWICIVGTFSRGWPALSSGQAGGGAKRAQKLLSSTSTITSTLVQAVVPKSPAERLVVLAAMLVGIENK
eukprot:1190949-Prorocentrum_minimum.AAC.3